LKLSSPSSSSSLSEKEDENDQGPSYPRDLHPLSVRVDYATGDMSEIFKDVDSVLVCAQTPCPFKSQDRGFTVTLNTARVYRCGNLKLTSYLATRHTLLRYHSREYRACYELVDPTALWYEFVLGYFETEQLYVIF